ncbi:MAG: phage tail protein [Synergistaceae bacterium]|jgi:phage protein U|nr:phage tail protein [Synergistaceae bacterium]
MKVGAFGDIVFEVSDSVIRTFRDFQKTVPARWAVHEILGHEPAAEFIGPGQNEISLPVTLNALFLDGKSIEDEIEVIEKMAAEGAVGTLVVGERVIGKFYLDSISETVSHFGGRGEFTHAEITLSLKHYAERASL